jgi:hypothetical protein
VQPCGTANRGPRRCLITKGRAGGRKSLGIADIDTAGPLQPNVIVELDLDTARWSGSRFVNEST